MDRRSVLKSVASAATVAGVTAARNNTILAGTDAAKAGDTAKVKAASPRFIEASDRTNLYYKDWGAGRPVLFIAAWSLSSDIWEYQMTYLSGQGVRCIAYDRRGHGRSDQPGHGYDYDTFAADLASVIEQLDLRDLTLVGHSMGGGEIVRYLSRHGSSRVSKIVLLAASTPFLLKTADNPDGMDRGVLEKFREALIADRPLVLTQGAPGVFGKGLPDCAASEAMIQWVVAICLQCSLKAAVETIRAVNETDFRSEMAKITVPTLIIHGDKDSSAPLELTARKGVKLIRGSRLEIYEGAPHGLPLTHTERLNRDLLAFIKQ